jgi:hypothetical protein
MAGASLRDGRSAADAEPTPKARTIALAATTYFIMIRTLTHTDALADSLARPVAPEHDASLSREPPPSLGLGVDDKAVARVTKIQVKI